MSTKDATNLFNFLTKAGVKLVLDNGIVSTSVTSTRSLTTEEQAILDDNLSDVVAILESQGEGDSLGSDSALKPGPSGTSSLRRGRDINNVETFNGLTGDVVGVGSFNGLTGDVVGVGSFNGLTGDVVGVGSFNGLTGDVVGVGSFNGLTGAVQGVASYNGNTGDVQGVSSFAGFTGDVAVGVTTNQILYHSGSSITGSNDFTFDGTDVVLGGDGHFDGGTDGPQQKKIKADEALAAGDPVYITGNVGASARVTVAKADASDSAKMPAAGIVKTAFSTNQEGYMTIGGSINQFNTAGYTANAQLYVSPGGGLTSARPISASDLVQKVVRVGRVSATTGTIIVTGAGRANDVPNLIHVRAGISMDAGGITFSDGTHQTSAAGGGAGSTLSVGFILDGNGSPLGTGDKLDALKQIPYDCYVLGSEAYVQSGISGSDKRIEMSVKKVKGLTAATSTIGSAGITLEIGSSGGSDVDILTFVGGAGLTYYYALGDNGNSAGSTLSKGEWIYPFVHGNSGDVDKIQLFLNLSPL
jgi:hypothetical protein